jgi:hypothetical protein
MSHAWTKNTADAAGSPASKCRIFRTHTANAATATAPQEILLSAWIIVSHPNPQQFEKLKFDLLIFKTDITDPDRIN